MCLKVRPVNKEECLLRVEKREEYKVLLLVVKMKKNVKFQSFLGHSFFQQTNPNFMMVT